jgi:glycosyltransferase involved in cell wall biosynthesis
MCFVRVKPSSIPSNDRLLERVTVAYSGVHQAFQLALAAQESGLLEVFLCSLQVRPGKWGGRLASIVGQEALASRDLPGLNPARTREFPWPALWKALRDRLLPGRSADWLGVNDAFDRWAAQQFRQRPTQILIGTETCARHSFEAARELSALRVLDCPQFHPAWLDEVMSEAAERARLPLALVPENPAMAARKQCEYELADWRLVYSEMHRRSFERAGFDPERQVEIPLWVDPTLWHAEPETARRPGPLRVLFAGSINLRKGIPFLLEAFERGRGAWELTLVGRVDATLRECFAPYEGRVRLLPPQTKADLRRLYAEHDVFVLPSVADSFGFVALEAMACGIPALVSDHCGAPVPHPGWRVHAMDVGDLADKIGWYAEQPGRAVEQGRIGQAFAARFTPQKYRDEIGAFLRKLIRADDSLPV